VRARRKRSVQAKSVVKSWGKERVPRKDLHIQTIVALKSLPDPSDVDN
jgi:hypothetical protein